MSAKHARPTRAQARAGALARQPQPWIAPEHRLEPLRPYSRGAGARRRNRGRRLLRGARGMLAIAALIAGASVVGVLGSGGSFALWSDDAPMGITPISSGDAGLVIHGTLQPVTNLLPGEAVAQAVSIENTGADALDVVATVATTYTNFELRSFIGDPATACTAALLASSPVTKASWAPDDTVPNWVIAAHQTLQLCVSVTATSTAQPADQVAFTLNLDGTQVQ